MACQIYQVQDESTKEEKQKRDWELAGKDKVREKEIEWWDKISDEDDLEQIKNKKSEISVKGHQTSEKNRH